MESINRSSFFGDLIKQNRTYFFAFGLFVVIGGILLSISTQGDGILLFSNNRSSFGDIFFFDLAYLWHP